MAQKYAKGSKAWGICGRSGRKMLLKDMVFDGRFPNMRVDPDWWEDKHPQEFMPKVEDPTALYRPSPEVIAPPTAPVLTASRQGNDVSITWTPSETDITEIASYSIYRGIDGVAPSLLITCNVLRDFLGGITGVQHCTTTPSIPADDTSDQPQHGDSSGSVFDKVTVEDAPITYVDTAVTLGHTYCYYVIGYPMGNNQSVGQGPPSAPSNTSCVALPAGGHTWARVYTEPGNFTSNAVSDFVFFSASRILAVGDLGTLLLSTDGGASWNSLTLAPGAGSPAFLNRSELAYNGSVVVITTLQASTGFNVVSRSTDQGATWTLVAPVGMNLLGQVIWSPLLNLFTAADGGSAVMWTSPDGLTWTSRALSAIFQANPASPHKESTEQFGKFIRVGGQTNGQIVTTSDGVAWTLTNISNPSLGFLIAAFDGTYVFADGISIGHRWLYRTTDGVTWSLASTSAVDTVGPFVPVCMQYAGVLVSGYPADGSNGLATSADHGSTFSTIGITTAMDGAFDAFDEAGGTFFATFGGTLSGIASTTDLSSWSDELDDGTVGLVVNIKTGFGITLAGGSQVTTQTAAIWKRS